MDGVDPGPGYIWVGTELIAPYTGKVINPDEQRIIPNASAEFDELYDYWSRQFDKFFEAGGSRLISVTYGDPVYFRTMSLSNNPELGLDFKEMPNLTIGRGAYKYSIVHGTIAENQFIGNALWAKIGKKFGWSLFSLRNGAGFAQIIRGTSSLDYLSWKTFFLPMGWDDPVDQFFIRMGYHDNFANPYFPFGTIGGR
ncbi:MAG: hypothetical protein RBT76_11740 [candidate division Zixibacteria bacterium]|nr:hypothetical protein [candidate division Zixibacteria bacterium]